MLPPGRARLCTKPSPTGSGTTTNTIGMVRVCSCRAMAAGAVLARIASGERAAISAEYVLKRVGSPAAKR
jgi:hypothetical protein